MKRKKNIINLRLLAVSLILFTVSYAAAQNGLQDWVIPGSCPTATPREIKTFDAENVLINSITLAPLVINKTPANSNPPFLYVENDDADKAYTVYANYTDENGNPLFYVKDNKIYLPDGYLIAEIGLYSKLKTGFPGQAQPNTAWELGHTMLGSDMKIIPVPGVCNQYYIVFTVEISKKSFGFFYLTLDMNLPNRYNEPPPATQRMGALTSNHTEFLFTYPNSDADTYIARSIDHVEVNDFTLPDVGGYSILFTNPIIYNEAPFRYMYITGKGGNIKRYKVDSQGFHDELYDLHDYIKNTFSVPQTQTIYELHNDPNQTTSAKGNGIMIDSDIYYDALNDEYKIAYATEGGIPIPSSQCSTGGVVHWPDFSSWGSFRCHINVVIATIYGSGSNEGKIKNFEGVFLDGSVKGVQRVSYGGLEFSHDGDYLYMSNNVEPYLYYVDVSNASPNGVYFPQEVPNGQDPSLYYDFQKGNIERGANDSDPRMFFARQGGVFENANSNAPTSSLSNARTFNLVIPEIGNDPARQFNTGTILPEGLNNEIYHVDWNINVPNGVQVPGFDDYEISSCPGSSQLIEIDALHPNDAFSDIKWKKMDLE